MSKLDRTQPVTPVFERERCPFNARQLDGLKKTEAQRRREAQAFNESREQRRASFMVKRQQTRPQLRPGPRLAAGVDRAAFNTQWAREEYLARRDQDAALARQAREARAALLESRETLSRAEQKRREAGSHQITDQSRAALKDAFITMRKGEQQARRAHSLNDAFMRKAHQR